MVGIPAGLLEDDPKVKPSKHIFVGSKAPWWDITDNILQYKEWFPGFRPKDQTNRGSKRKPQKFPIHLLIGPTLRALR